MIDREKAFNSTRCSLAFLLLLTLCAVSVQVACTSSPKNDLERAGQAWDSGDYKTAAEHYERYLQTDAGSDRALEARFNLANIYYLNLHRYEYARLHYRKLLDLDPSNVNAFTARKRLAEVLAEMGRSYEAIAEYENLNSSDPTERRKIRLQIADLYFDQKNYSQALTEYEKVVENVPYDELSGRAYLREASIYNARGVFQQSLPVYQKLIASSTDSKTRMRAIYGMSDCYAGLYQFDEAIKTLRQIDEEEEKTYAHRRIAELEQHKREASRARNAAQQ